MLYELVPRGWLTGDRLRVMHMTVLSWHTASKQVIKSPRLLKYICVREARAVKVSECLVASLVHWNSQPRRPAAHKRHNTHSWKIYICIPCGARRCSLLYKHTHTHTKRNAMQITPIGTSIHGLSWEMHVVLCHCCENSNYMQRLPACVCVAVKKSCSNHAFLTPSKVPARFCDCFWKVCQNFCLYLELELNAGNRILDCQHEFPWCKILPFLPLYIESFYNSVIFTFPHKIWIKTFSLFGLLIIAIQLPRLFAQSR